MRPYIFVLPAYLFLLALGSCKKYLDKKPQRSNVLITSLDDVQRLLDRHDVMNEGSVSGLLNLIADDYYVSDNALSGVDQHERMNYLWDANAMYDNGWIEPYQKSVYYANVMLDQLPSVRVRENEVARFNELKSAALFFRAYCFFHLAQLYCKPYDQSTAGDPGIVVRMSSAINDKSARATVQETYQQIIRDLQEAARYLPEKNTYPTRPEKAAAFGMLARVYLSMRNYTEAAAMADSCLKRRKLLINYNTLDSTAVNPFTRFNVETIFYSTLSQPTLLTIGNARTDSMLIREYEDGDLRLPVFYGKSADGSYYFKGSYEGDVNTMRFNGIATDEIYLIRAEAAARSGNIPAALSDLDQLLKNRWDPDKYTAPVASSAAEALDLVLKERRKEMIFRGQRWTDVRRLNLEGRAVTLNRKYNGSAYTLPANDPRWVLLIPDKVISLSSISQNPR